MADRMWISSMDDFGMRQPAVTNGNRHRISYQTHKPEQPTSLHHSSWTLTIQIAFWLVEVPCGVRTTLRHRTPQPLALNGSGSRTPALTRSAQSLFLRGTRMLFGYAKMTAVCSGQPTVPN